MGTSTTRTRGRLFLTCLLVVAMLLGTLGLPTKALARDYSIDRVDIDATVAADGSVTVNEMRDFDFDGSFNGVYWKIPSGRYEGREIEVTIGSVGILEDGELKLFQPSDSGMDGTFEVTEYSTYTQVKIYSAHEDEHARFVISYTDSNLASRYADTAELYWKFVSDGWDVSSNNVNCVVHLPIPAGESVSPEENVRAWGHGPLDATVGFDGNDVVYDVPGVGTEEFAEARITFPAEWLSGVESGTDNRLDSIISQEQAWAEEANQRREAARATSIGFLVASVAAAAGSLALALKRRDSYKRSHKATFDDKYFRDVPSRDHPAVLGTLLHEGDVEPEAMTASLMRLTDMGAIKLDLVRKKVSKGLFKREETEEDYRITKLSDARAMPGEPDASRVIDDKTLGVLFSVIAPLNDRSKANVLDFKDIEKFADDFPSTYSEVYDDWKAEIENAAVDRGFFEDPNKVGKGLPIAVAVVEFVLAFILLIAIIAEVVVWYAGLIGLAVLIATGVYLLVVVNGFEELSPEAVELRAKLEALERWLKDFTRLEEAVPRDVVLWNRLLVMAVVLGVADEVIAQLKVVAPEVLESAAMRPVYGWYYYGGMRGGVTPASAFGGAVETAHSVSSAALAASSSSSGGGGGGGFSGGGGGGFGGGGGGGAF